MGSTRLLAIGLLVLSGCGTADVLEAAYPTVEAARSDGAFARGWLPEWVPSKAIDLREVHSLDTNESALVFRLAERTAWVPATCSRVESGQFIPSRFTPDQWPQDSELARSYSVYRCPSDAAGLPVFVAEQRDGLGGLHWRVADL